MKNNIFILTILTFFSFPSVAQVSSVPVLGKTIKPKSGISQIPASLNKGNQSGNKQSAIKTSAWCLSDKVTNNFIQQQISQNPNYLLNMNALSQQLQKWIANNPNYLSQKAVKTIPVAVHVLYNNAAENVSTALINDMIATLNEDFRRLNSDTTQTRAIFEPVAADAQMEFCLAIRDPGNNATDGIVRKSTTKTYWDPDTETNDMKKTSTGGDDAWDPYNYLNIWICDIDNGAGFGTAGYAYFPTFGMHGSWMDGLVIDNDIGVCYGCRTATHEIGHYFGLEHTWGNNPPSCSDDDGFSDTPTNVDENYGCNYSQNTCSNDVPNMLDQIENYMSYADCQNMFTTMQANYMNSVLNTTRNSLLSSDGCTPAAPPVADFSAAPNPVYLGSTVLFSDLTSGYPASWSWNFGGGGTPNTSTQQNPVITFSTIGVYTITLTATNSLGSDSEVKTSFLNVIALPPCGIAGAIFCEDFEGVTFPALPTGWSTTGNATSNFFKTGDYISCKSFYFSPPDHSKFAYTNDDTCNCNKANDILQLPSQNFTGNSNVVMTFNSYMDDDNNAAYLDSAYVQVSTNGGTSWTTVFNIPKIKTWSNYVANLSAYDNMNNVMLRFKYNDKGNWGYGIAIDDVVIKENNNHDLKVTSINKYDLKQLPGYLLVPNRQTGNIVPAAQIDNIGANTEANVVLNVKIYDPDGNLVYDNNSAPGSVGSFQSAVLSTAIFNVPKTETGTYTYSFTASSDSADGDVSNNTYTDYYIVTDTIYERMDTLAPFYALSAQSFGTAAPYRFGNIYEIVNNDTATSISFVPYTTSVVGSQVRVVIYDSSQTQIAQSNIYTLQSSDLGTLVTVSFTSGVPLNAGVWYIASVNSLSTVDSAVTFFSGTIGGGMTSSMLYTDLGQGAGFKWYTITVVPWILLNVKQSVITCNNVVSVTTSSATCGNCNGQATVTVTGANGPFTYSWNDGANQTTSTATGLCGGSYQVLVTNSGCSYTNGGSVSNGSSLSVSTTATPDSCEKGVGTATVTATGGTPGYSYVWSGTGNQTTSTATGLTFGLYHVTVTDNAGCTINTDFFSAASIGYTSAIQTVALDTNYASCGVCTDGSASITSASGGTSPYSYSWSSGGTGSAATGLVPGNYGVTTTDANGCSKTTSFVISFTTGLIQTKGDRNIEIFPNPTDGIISIRFGNTDLTIKSVKITDLIGRTVFEKEVVSGTTIIPINFVNEYDGLYFLQLFTDAGVIARKITLVK